MLYYILRFVSAVLCNLLLGIEVFGTKNIPRKGGFVLASNHRSLLDPVVLGVACPRKLNFMAKEELFRNPFFGWLIRQLGAFPIRRNQADVSAVRRALKKVKAGNGLLVFPEGSRDHNQPQAGVGFLASKADIPIVPAFIEGTEEALPRGARSIRCRKVSVYFGKQIFIETKLSYQEIAQRIMEDIRKLSA